MNDTCASAECQYACYCRDNSKCVHVNKETKKGIANNVARTVCSDWKMFSVSSLLESDGSRLETLIHQEQRSKGYRPCFRAPY